MATQYSDYHSFNHQSMHDGEELYEGDGEFADEDSYYEEGYEDHDAETYGDNEMQEDNYYEEQQYDEGEHGEHDDNFSGNYDTPNAPQNSVSFFNGAQNFSLNGGTFSAVSGSYYNLGHGPGLGQGNPRPEAHLPTYSEALNEQKSAPQSRTTAPHQQPSGPLSNPPPPKKAHRRRKAPEPSFFKGAHDGDINGGTFSSVEGSYYNYGNGDGEQAPPSPFAAPSPSRYVDPDNVGPKWRRSSKATNTYNGTESLRGDRQSHPPPPDLGDLPRRRRRQTKATNTSNGTESLRGDHQSHPLPPDLGDLPRRRRPISHFEGASNFRIISGNYMTVGGEYYGPPEPHVRNRSRSQRQARQTHQPSQSQRPQVSVAKDASSIPRSGSRKLSQTHTVVSPRLDQFSSPPSRSPKAPYPIDIPGPSLRRKSDGGPVQQPNSSTNADMVASSSRESAAVSEKDIDVRSFTAQLGNLSLSYKRSKSSARHSQTQARS